MPQYGFSRRLSHHLLRRTVFRPVCRRVWNTFQRQGLCYLQWGRGNCVHVGTGQARGQSVSLAKAQTFKLNQISFHLHVSLSESRPHPIALFALQPSSADAYAVRLVARALPTHARHPLSASSCMPSGEAQASQHQDPPHILLFSPRTALLFYIPPSYRLPLPFILLWRRDALVGCRGLSQDRLPGPARVCLVTPCPAFRVSSAQLVRHLSHNLCILHTPS